MADIVSMPQPAAAVAARDLITVRALADVQAEMSELVGLEVFKSMGGDGESPPATEG